MASKTTKSTDSVKSLTRKRHAAKGKASKGAAAPKAKASKGNGDGSSASNLSGRKAPAFAAPDQSGETVSLAALLKGGNLVLYFYPKDMTPGCTTEACSFRDNLEAVRALGAQVVGVSGDSAQSHRKFIEKHNLNFPLLSDPDHVLSKAYGVYKMKSLYGRQFMGIERTTVIIGRDGVVKRVFAKVKVNGHSEEVLAALKELG